jgi:peptidoglycan/xylan/chitin deacetylase (PgdA/CDA1 family)
MKWYCFLYHGVSFGEDLSLKGIGGTITPYLFEQHVSLLSEFGDIVTPTRAMELMENNSSSNDRKRIVSIVFDDGFKSVYSNAYPILKAASVPCGIGVCSDFYMRRDILYRMKLSYIHFNDGDKYLRSRLSKLLDKKIESLKAVTINTYSTDIINIINDMYDDISTAEERILHKKQFCSIDDLLELQAEGWDIINHTKSHYPITNDITKDFVYEQFLSHQRDMYDDFGGISNIWNIPFGNYNNKFLDIYHKYFKNDGTLMFCDNKVNDISSVQRNQIYRFVAPIVSYGKMKKYLRSIR